MKVDIFKLNPKKKTYCVRRFFFSFLKVCTFFFPLKLFHFPIEKYWRYVLGGGGGGEDTQKNNPGKKVFDPRLSDNNHSFWSLQKSVFTQQNLTKMISFFSFSFCVVRELTVTPKIFLLGKTKCFPDKKNETNWMVDAKKK